MGLPHTSHTIIYTRNDEALKNKRKANETELLVTSVFMIYLSTTIILIATNGNVNSKLHFKLYFQICNLFLCFYSVN